MARVDDYQASFDISAQKLSDQNFAHVAQRSGGQVQNDGRSLIMDYYNRPVLVEQAPCRVTVMDQGPEIPLAEQALILHYLEMADGTPPTDQWIAFREVSGGEFYWSAYVRRANAPLLSFFGQRPDFLLEVAPRLGGKTQNGIGDAAVVIPAFPLTSFLLVLWQGDEEFPPEANVLLDANVSHFLGTEDIALAAGLSVYKLMALSKI